MAKYWASVKANFDFYTEEIEADTLDEAKSKAYDIVKEKMAIHDKDLRPFGISVIAAGKVVETEIKVPKETMNKYIAGDETPLRDLLIKEGYKIKSKEAENLIDYMLQKRDEVKK